VSSLRELVDLVTERIPWGLHSLKLAAALLVPAMLVWLADRRVSMLAARIAEEDAARRKLPRIRRA
jgi:hypothetical protein